MSEAVDEFKKSISEGEVISDKILEVKNCERTQILSTLINLANWVLNVDWRKIVEEEELGWLVNWVSNVEEEKLLKLANHDLTDE